MTIYAVHHHDRHADPDVELFPDLQSAITRAWDIARENARSEDDIEEIDSREELYLVYSDEGDDTVIVMKRELNEDP